MKIGIAGTGGVAKNNYAPCLSEIEDVELFYYNRTKEKAEALAAEHAGTVCDSLEDLVGNDLDAIMVLTSERGRSEVAHALVDLKPKRLFFEKPLVAKNGQDDVTEADFTDAHELLKKAKEAGIETAMIFNYRFFEQTMTAKKIIAERNWGKLWHSTAFVVYACWSHCIDLVFHFSGPVREITAIQGEAPKAGSDQDAPDVVASYITEAGAAGTIIGTWGINWSFPLYEISLNYEGGRLRFTHLDGDMEVMDNESARHETFMLPKNKTCWDWYNASFVKSITAYVDSIRNNSPAPVPGIDGLYELQFEAGLRRSIAEKRPVNLPEEFPIDV